MSENQTTNEESKSSELSPEAHIPSGIIDESADNKEKENVPTVYEKEKQLATPSYSKSILTFSQSKNTSPTSTKTNTNKVLSDNFICYKEKPSIRIHVPLKGQVNVYVNFAREAEKQYGWTALHPLQATNLVKLGMLKFDNELDSDEGDESESNVDDDRKFKLSATHTENENSNLQEPFIPVPKKRKRRIQEEEYDTLDPFIDDSELFLEEIAASKDGFFVFSGPLIPKGDKVKIERTDESTKKGRSRGGKQNANRMINKNTKPKEAKSPKENNGKKNVKTIQNTKHTEQSENKKSAHLEKTIEKKEPKELKANKNLTPAKENLESNSTKSVNETKENKDTTTQKSKKSKKIEKPENEQD
ncbi:hypothetical protein PNEG_03236 [Pneumocystis murina B123]|uniref:Hpc2-related domain-containing protein n=1 Tax=Pneumocystis murina (strain B123) TaxID=1069680 RepID=M7PD68_PNEMU|nr:hypothetical protein PNEG_03236 [Pneumocystis murina B123]EMR08399.1 hypothetical protein PNEG_03236 [Pneumocystis murina B123]